LEPQRYWLFTGRRSDVEHVRACADGYRVRVTDRSREHAVLAVQGPRSWIVINRCLSGLPPVVPYYAFCDARLESAVCRVARVGYSGETGYELIVSIQDGLRLWQALVAAGRDCGISECGFESADSLRIEAGHILFTRELALPVGPFELGLGRLLDFERAPAIGMTVLRARRWKDPLKRLVGLIPDSGDLAAITSVLETTCYSDPPARPGRARLTSVCMSPIFGRIIGLGFVAAEDRYPGSRVSLGRGVRARGARLPFYDPARVLPRR
jgi:aminomethyltransferase